MNWLLQLPETQPIAYAVGVLAVVCVAGMALGSIRWRGVGLGASGVLFTGILFGHFQPDVDHSLLDFVKELGLILFVFTIGLQLGPGFFAALRKQGLKLNLYAAALVLLGAVAAPLFGRLAGVDDAAVLGVFSGASTNTPSLGAAAQTLALQPDVEAERLALPALAYAVTYPAAIVGIIVTLLALKRLFRVDVEQEAAEFAERNRRAAEPLERRTLIVENHNLEGLALESVPGRVEAKVTISRIRHGDETRVATDETILHVGDRLAVVGTVVGLAHFERVVGRRTDEDLLLADTGITFRRVVVTARRVLGRSIGELSLDERLGVAVTRITRADMEMTAIPGLRLQFGDRLQIVGAPADLDKATTLLGNSLKSLNETHFVPFFTGIALGIALGTLPIALPGLPYPVKLGLAGGPLIVALLLSRLGHVGRLVWHMPANTNLAFREFGIALFFAAVGLQAGEKFFQTVFSPAGLTWLLVGLCVTVLPLLIVGVVARKFGKLSFLELSGLIAGGMTDPPALAFATNLANCDSPVVAYATVYPLTTLLRILAAQILAGALIA